jgi:hypothetical protein
MMPAVIAAEGTAFALLAGLDGSVTWQAARVLMGDRLGRLVHPPGRARRPGRDGFRARDRRHRGRRGCGQRAAGGVILLVWGAAALVRAIPGWWRLLAIPSALVLLWFVLLPLTIAVNATSRPPGPLERATPARYGLAYQDVAFRTADGVRLSA